MRTILGWCAVLAVHSAWASAPCLLESPQRGASLVADPASAAVAVSAGACSAARFKYSAANPGGTVAAVTDRGEVWFYGDLANTQPQAALLYRVSAPGKTEAFSRSKLLPSAPPDVRWAAHPSPGKLSLYGSNGMLFEYSLQEGRGKLTSYAESEHALFESAVDEVVVRGRTGKIQALQDGLQLAGQVHGKAASALRSFLASARQKHPHAFQLALRRAKPSREVLHWLQLPPSTSKSPTRALASSRPAQ